MDNTDFWNVWRLTPAVYRTSENEWVVKHEINKIQTAKENIEYIFNATVDIILSIHTKQLAVKASPERKYYIELNQKKVPIYEKADTTSKIIFTASDVTRVACDYLVMGLRGDADYWHVNDFKHEPYLYGFIHIKFVKQVIEVG